MGLAASRFATLTELCTYAPKKFGNVQLSAVVLSDPTRDDRFNRHLTKRMDELNTRTGNCFLFFALVDPPQAWDGAPNPILRNDGRCMNMPSLSETGDRAALYNFLAQIGYKNAPLPGILLTTGDLKSKSYIYFPTSVKHIDEQLIELGDFCSHLSDQVKLNSDELAHLLDRIAPKRISASSKVSVADSLRLVSAYSDVNSESSYNRTLATKLICQSLQVSPQKQDMRYAANLAQCIETASVDDRFMELENKSPLPPIDFSNIPQVDDETMQNWNTYNVLLLLPYMAQILHRQYHQEINFSIMNLPLIVGVENELNLSIVQLMREKFKISMPEYYCRWKKGLQAHVVHGLNSHLVDLNKRSNKNQRGNLSSVSIGDIRAAYIELIPDYFGSKSDSFTDLLNSFSQARIAHPGIGETSVEQMMDDFQKCRRRFDQEFLTFLPDLCKIKETLSCAGEK